MNAMALFRNPSSVDIRFQPELGDQRRKRRALIPFSQIMSRPAGAAALPQTRGSGSGNPSAG